MKCTRSPAPAAGTAALTVRRNWIFRFCWLRTMNTRREEKKDLSSWRLARLTALPEEKQPSACIGCGQCTAHCPQGLDVPAYMKEMAELM